MRSDFPMPGDPWPHGMVIHVESAPHDLLTLLYARAVLGLRIDGVPEAEGIPRSAPRPDAELEARWRRDWATAWERFEEPSIRPPDAERLRLIAETPDEELAGRFFSISSDWLDDRGSFDTWQRGLTRHVRQRLEDTPERRSLPALVDAWRSGLHTVVELPYATHFAERITARHLVVARITRADPSRYSEALALR